MGTGAKIRSAEENAETARELARAAIIHQRALAKYLGLETVRVPAGENLLTVRYRRKLPRWIAWVRRLGVWR